MLTLLFLPALCSLVLGAAEDAKLSKLPTQAPDKRYSPLRETPAKSLAPDTQCEGLQMVFSAQRPELSRRLFFKGYTLLNPREGHP